MDDDDDDISYFGNIHPVDGKVKFTTPKLGNSHSMKVNPQLSQLKVCTTTI